MSIFSVGILTGAFNKIVILIFCVVSDSVSLGQTVDQSSPAIQQKLATDHENAVWNVVELSVVPDNLDQIQTIIKLWSAHRKLDLVLTTGGTGFGQRDVTPEAVRPLLNRLAPGLELVMLMGGMSATPYAALSRPCCGIRSNSIIITLPGSPKGAVENLEVLLPILPHAIELCRGSTTRHDSARLPPVRIQQSMATMGSGSSGSGNAVHDEPSATGTMGHTGFMGPSGIRNLFTAFGKPSSTLQRGASVTSSATLHTTSPINAPNVASATATSAVVSNRRSYIPAPPSSGRTGGSQTSAGAPGHARGSPYAMLSVDEALAIVLMHSQKMPARYMKVLDPRLVGSVVAENIRAIEDVPAYRASTMDGYAVLARDGPGVYPVFPSPNYAQSISSADGSSRLPPGQIVKIMTGAPLPIGATAVVPIENTVIVSTTVEGAEEQVEIQRTVREGDNIRDVGSDLSVGDIIMRHGDLITEIGGEVGLLVSGGVREVRVYACPVVGVMSTGNELVEDGVQDLKYGEVRDANRPSLMAAVKAAGFKVLDLGIIRDDPESLHQAIERGFTQCDVIVSTGGVSMGDLDLLKSVLEQRLHATVHFGRVEMKPGKPTTFATVPRVIMEGDPASESRQDGLVFALPGNPVSALVTFHMFVLPALRKLMGMTNPELPMVQVKLLQDIRLDQGRPEFHRALVQVDHTTGTLVATSTGDQRSSRIASVRGANALLRLPSVQQAGVERIPRGDMVEAWLIGRL